MALIDSRTSRVLLTVLVFALGLGFLYTARHTLVAFLFAIFFAYLVDPLVSKLENLVRGRGRAIAIIYVLLLALLAVFFHICWAEDWEREREAESIFAPASGACLKR